MVVLLFTTILTTISNLIQRIKASREDLCQNHINECNELRCPYGISRTYDENDCERCECENPCRDYLCPEDSKCAVDIRSDQQSGSSFAPVCRKSKFSHLDIAPKTNMFFIFIVISLI